MSTEEGTVVPKRNHGGLAMIRKKVCARQGQKRRMPNPTDVGVVSSFTSEGGDISEGCLYNTICRSRQSYSQDIF